VSQRPEDLLEARVREALDRIPGYRGYRLKEERRDADRRVRAAVADAYATELTRIERIGRDLANARRLGEIAAVERASQAIRHYIDRVRSVTPGYGGLFGDRDIDGVALDQLRLFDEGLLVGVEEIRPAIDRLEQAFAAGEPLAPAADELARTIEEQLTRLDRRNDVIETGRALSHDSVVAALKPLSEIMPPEVFSAQSGDAISILGDDFLVSGKIDVDGRPLSFRLFRIARDPEEWLMVGRDPDSPMVRMTLVEAPPVPIPPGRAPPSAHDDPRDEPAATDRRDRRRRNLRGAWVERVACRAVRSAQRRGRPGGVRAYPRLGRRAPGVHRSPYRTDRRRGLSADRNRAVASRRLAGPGDRRNLMAGMMDRVMRLVRANVNDLIDQAEDPEKMIDQILREMNESLVMARAQVASMIAQEKELELEVQETRKLAGEWGKKAERAVQAGKDDLAREALRRKRDNEENSAIYAEQLGVQKQAVAKLKDQLRQLEAKYQTTLGSRDSLVARQRRARSQRQVAEAIVVFTPLDPSSELDRMERKIRSEEAHAMAALEVGEESFDSQFQALEAESDVEDELEALKASLGAGGGSPSLTAGGNQ
jgi:phage shock protein A